MKKIILFVLAISASATIHAQLFSIGGVDIGYLYLGPKLGMHGAWVSNTQSNFTETKVLWGYQAGVVGKFGITQSISIQPELLFSRKGYRQEANTGIGETRTIANYIGIPILGKIKVIKIGDLSLHGSGGIYTNITTSSKSTYEADQFSEEFVIDRSDYKTVDFGFSFGGGASYELTTGIIVAELTIDHGVVDMYEDNISTENNRNTTVGLSATYLFDIVKFGVKNEPPAE
jgi:hypothetical protein